MRASQHHQQCTRSQGPLQYSEEPHGEQCSMALGCPLPHCWSPGTRAKPPCQALAVGVCQSWRQWRGVRVCQLVQWGGSLTHCLGRRAWSRCCSSASPRSSLLCCRAAHGRQRGWCRMPSVALRTLLTSAALAQQVSSPVPTKASTSQTVALQSHPPQFLLGQSSHREMLCCTLFKSCLLCACRLPPVQDIGSL